MGHNSHAAPHFIKPVHAARMYLARYLGPIKASYAVPERRNGQSDYVRVQRSSPFPSWRCYGQGSPIQEPYLEARTVQDEGRSEPDATHSLSTPFGRHYLHEYVDGSNLCISCCMLRRLLRLYTQKCLQVRFT